MKKKLKINVSKSPQTDGIVSCRHMSIREKILSFLFGENRRLTVLIPGDGVDEVLISGEEGGQYGKDETD